MVVIAEEHLSGIPLVFIYHHSAPVSKPLPLPPLNPNDPVQIITNNQDSWNLGHIATRKPSLVNSTNNTVSSACLTRVVDGYSIFPWCIRKDLLNALAVIALLLLLGEWNLLKIWCVKFKAISHQMPDVLMSLQPFEFTPVNQSKISYGGTSKLSVPLSRCEYLITAVDKSAFWLILAYLFGILSQSII